MPTVVGVNGLRIRNEIIRIQLQDFANSDWIRILPRLKNVKKPKWNFCSSKILRKSLNKSSLPAPMVVITIFSNFLTKMFCKNV